MSEHSARLHGTCSLAPQPGHPFHAFSCSNDILPPGTMPLRPRIVTPLPPCDGTCNPCGRLLACLPKLETCRDIQVDHPPHLISSNAMTARIIFADSSYAPASGARGPHCKAVAVICTVVAKGSSALGFELGLM
jgi:hypothetical protein